MKYKPTDNTIPLREKTKYLVTIENEQYETYAHSEEAALSNAAWRYASDQDEEVALVKWKIKQELLYWNVEEA